MFTSRQKENQIFISYRRRDSTGITGRIYDRLTQRFGKEAIFKDVDSVPLGVDFRHYIDAEVKKCDVVLAVIGDKWLGEITEGGNYSINNPKDFVRIEIESALQSNISIVPLFVQGAVMPPEESLPSSLQALAYRNGFVIGDDPRFHTDVDRLIKKIEVYFARLNRLGNRVKKGDAPAQLLSTQSNDNKRRGGWHIVRKVILYGAMLLTFWVVGVLFGNLVDTYTETAFFPFAVAIPTWVFGIVLTIIVWQRSK